MSNITPHAQRSEKGQSLVEFSLMGIFLVILLMGILDLGRAYFTYLAIKDAAAEGAYFASAYPQCELSGSAPGCAGSYNVNYRVKNSSPQSSLVDWSASFTTIGVTVPVSRTAGNQIVVTVNYRYQMLTPLVGAIAGDQSLILSATSSATIIRVPNCSVNPCQ